MLTAGEVRPLSAWLSVHWPSTAVALIFGAMAGYPMWSFYWWGWAWRRDDIVLSIPKEAKRTYLQIFFCRQDVVVEEAEQEFSKIYLTWYGRRHLLIPMAELVILSTVQSFFVAELGFSYVFPNAGFLGTFPIVAAAAFLGAYLFVLSDLIRSSSRKDLTAGGLLLGAVRIALSIAIGYAFSAIVKDDLGAFIAFAIGAFPLTTIQTVLRRIANKYLELDIGPDSLSDQVVKLSGVDPPIADRIGETGITTIAQLAYCDPVQLTMQTNLTYSYIMDIVGQSLAWVYLGDKMPTLRESGLRGAIEIRHLYLAVVDPAKQAQAEAIVQSLSAATGISNEGLLNALMEIAEDPYTKFLESCWTDPTVLSPTPAPVAPPPPPDRPATDHPGAPGDNARAGQ